MMDRRGFLKDAIAASPLVALPFLPSCARQGDAPVSSISSGYRAGGLSNGISVIVEPNDSGLTRAWFGVNYGAINEEKPGLAHLVEHLLMYGGAGPHDHLTKRELWNVLPEWNGGSNLEWIHLYADMHPDQLEIFLEIASHSIFDPRFEEEVLNQQAKIVMEEIVEETSHPRYRDQRRFRRALYGDDHPLTFDIVGRKDVIENVQQSDLFGFTDKGFKTNLMYLLLVGEFPDDVDRVVHNYFGQHPADYGTAKQIPAVDILTENKVIGVDAPDLNKGNVTIDIAWNTDVVATHKDYFAMQVMNYLFGYSYGSRLMKEVRRERGLVYWIRSVYSPTYYNGGFSISTSTGSDPDHVLDAIFAVVTSMKEVPVTAREIEQYARHHEFWWRTKLLSNEGRMNALWGWGSGSFALRYQLRAIRSITPEDVMRVAQAYMPDQDGAYVVMKRFGSSSSGELAPG